MKMRSTAKIPFLYVKGGLVAPAKICTLVILPLLEASLLGNQEKEVVNMGPNLELELGPMPTVKVPVTRSCASMTAPTTA